MCSPPEPCGALRSPLQPSQSSTAPRSRLEPPKALHTAPDAVRARRGTKTTSLTPNKHIRQGGR
eukprot:10596357-Alexandrium_andersonii.AAC.1